MSTKLKEQVMKAFAKRLRAARKRAGYRSAEKFAQALGMEPHSYRHYERGGAEPDLTRLTRICQLLRSSPNELLPLAVAETDGGENRSAA